MPRTKWIVIALLLAAALGVYLWYSSKSKSGQTFFDTITSEITIFNTKGKAT